jgi:dipeptidyl aminopeptidase/acylaminoacyl peptidase
MTDVEERIRQELRRSIPRPDEDGVADRVLARISARRRLRQIGRAVLAVAVIGASGLIVLALSSVVTSRDPEAGSRVGSRPRSTETAIPPSEQRGPILDMPVSPMADAPRGTILFSGSEPGSISALYRLDPSTADLAMVTDDGAPESAVSSPDGTRIALMYDGRDGIFVIHADGGDPTRITDVGTEPAWSPDGRRIAYSVSSVEDGGDLRIVDITTGEDRSIGTAGWPAWSPDGSAIVASDGELALFDPDTGERTPLGVEGYRADWSPDGTTIAFCRDDGIYVVDVDGTDVRKLTHASGYFLDPSWSPDGTAIAFSYDLPDWAKHIGNGPSPMMHEVFVMRSDGSDIHRLTALTSPELRNSGVSPDWHPTEPGAGG